MDLMWLGLELTPSQVLLIPSDSSTLPPTSLPVLLIHIETISQASDGAGVSSACISPVSLGAALPGSIPVTPTVNCTGYEAVPVAKLVYFPLTGEVFKLVDTFKPFIDLIIGLLYVYIYACVYVRARCRISYMSPLLRRLMAWPRASTLHLFNSR